MSKEGNRGDSPGSLKDKDKEKDKDKSRKIILKAKSDGKKEGKVNLTIVIRHLE